MVALADYYRADFCNLYFADCIGGEYQTGSIQKQKTSRKDWLFLFGCGGRIGSHIC